MKALKNIFNASAMVGGAALVVVAAGAFLSGFADCGPDVIGACINPGVLFHTPLGVAAVAVTGAMGGGLFSLGYKGLKGADKPATPKP
jgi:hypothetical protein